MPSRSLGSSWTTTVVPSGTHASPHKAYTAKPSRLHRRLPLLRHIHGLWKGVSSPNHNHLASQPGLRRVSSNICVSGPALVAEPTPTHSSPDRSPPSPTPPTPASFSRGGDAGFPGIADSDLEAGDVPSAPSEGRMLSITGDGLFREPCRQPTSPSSENSALAALASPRRSAASGPWCRVDAATRLQDFRALIAEMRVTLFDYDFNKEFDSGDRDEEERERLLRLLEDVMRKVKQLAENDTGLGSAESHENTSSCSQVTV